MDGLFLVTDDPGRSAALASDLGDVRVCRVYDVHDGKLPIAGPSALVSDVVNLSAAASPLRQVLDRVRGTAPLLILLHQASAHARVEAIALGATAMLDAVADPDLIRTTLAKIEAENAVPPAAERLVGAAQRFIAELLTATSPVTLAAIDDGAEFVEQAVHAIGVRDWVRQVQRFDDATHQHCLLVAGLAASFATHLGFSEPDCRRLTKAALLHDVGKVHVPPAILNKPGKLDETETAIVRMHPERGHAMLVGRGFEDEVLAVVRSHHEMLDGSGYPDGLSGDAIPDLVRLVTICDIYAALIERRAYKAPLPAEIAYAIIEDMRGRLDPVLVAAFRPVAASFTHSLVYPFTTGTPPCTSC